MESGAEMQSCTWQLSLGVEVLENTNFFFNSYGKHYHPAGLVLAGTVSITLHQPS